MVTHGWGEADASLCGSRGVEQELNRREAAIKIEWGLLVVQERSAEQANTCHPSPVEACGSQRTRP